LEILSNIQYQSSRHKRKASPHKCKAPPLVKTSWWRLCM